MTPARFFQAALLLAAGLLPVPAPAHGALGTVLAKIEREIREHPENYLERSERAWLMLEHEMTGQPVGRDIDTLLTKPAWRETGLRLRVLHLYLLGRHREAEARARENIAAGVVGPEQYRVMAGVALAKRDSLGAFRAFREGWMRLRLEEDYISMLGMRRSWKEAAQDVSGPVLEEGLRAYPGSPGVHAAIFNAYLEDRAPASLERALAISERGHAQLWTGSVDWKLRHARALLASGRPDSAQVLLLRAMDMIEGETRLRPGANEAVRLRHEIFELLEAAR